MADKKAKNLELTNLDITNTSKRPTPRVLFADIKNKALGEKYELSLVFVNSKKSKVINKKTRGKDYPTNILSFPLDKNSGEIFIDLELCKKEAPRFERNYTNFIAFLFIHGLMHLKGFDHGSTMESKERALRRLFDI